MGLLKSEGVLRRVVEKEKLDQEPDFAPAPTNGLLARLKALIRGPASRTTAQDEALQNLASRVSVRRAGPSSVFTVEATSASPATAARIVQALLEAATADLTTLNQPQEAPVPIGQHDAALAEISDQLHKIEARVDEVQKSNTGNTAGGANPSGERLDRLNTELATARILSAEAAVRAEQARDASRTNNLEGLPNAVKSPLIQTLRKQDAEIARHEAALSSQSRGLFPDDLKSIRAQRAAVQDQINAELKRIAAAARKEEEIAAARVREVQSMLDNATAESTFPAPAPLDIGELKRELVAVRERIQAALTRANERPAQIPLSSREIRIVIVDGRANPYDARAPPTSDPVSRSPGWAYLRNRTRPSEGGSRAERPAQQGRCALSRCVGAVPAAEA